MLRKEVANIASLGALFGLRRRLRRQLEASVIRREYSNCR